jgi:hypothetical protein
MFFVTECFVETLVQLVKFRRNFPPHTEQNIWLCEPNSSEFDSSNVDARGGLTNVKNKDVQD